MIQNLVVKIIFIKIYNILYNYFSKYNDKNEKKNHDNDVDKLFVARLEAL